MAICSVLTGYLHATVTAHTQTERVSINTEHSIRFVSHVIIIETKLHLNLDIITEAYLRQLVLHAWIIGSAGREHARRAFATDGSAWQRSQQGDAPAGQVEAPSP